jgi:glucose uptake protein GlcU
MDDSFKLGIMTVLVISGIFAIATGIDKQQWHDIIIGILLFIICLALREEY